MVYLVDRQVKVETGVRKRLSVVGGRTPETLTKLEYACVPPAGARAGTSHRDFPTKLNVDRKSLSFV